MAGGIYSANLRKCAVEGLDSRFRGNDWHFGRDPTQMTPLPPAASGDYSLVSVDVAPTFRSASAGLKAGATKCENSVRSGGHTQSRPSSLNAQGKGVLTWFLGRHLYY